MLNLSIIGNLGADAELKAYNGREFVSFRVAHTEKFARNGETVRNTIWVDVTLSGNGGGLLSYLKKGKTVFVSGSMSLRIYDSAKEHCKKAGVSLMARTVELCGGNVETFPSELTTTDGEIVHIDRVYSVREAGVASMTLLDRNMKQYYANEVGIVKAAEEVAF